MGRRTYVAAAEKLGKQRNYEAALRQWASKFQWRARFQAFDAAQLEKEREDSEQARLEIYATAFTLGRYFFEHVAEDLKRQWQGDKSILKPARKNHIRNLTRSPLTKC